MWYRNSAIAVALAALIGGSGCAAGMPAGGATTFFDDDAGQPETSLLRVVNNNWSDMTIYLVHGGVQSRIGHVGGLQSAQFRLPAVLIGTGGDVMLIARPLASREGYATQRLRVAPGQRIDLHLENNLNLSHFAVW
jgi:hypothetical protein